MLPIIRRGEELRLRGDHMLRPEIIDTLRRQREERDRPILQIPLFPPEDVFSRFDVEEEEGTEASGVIVIDLA
jgi:hypothetical protein